MYKVFFMLAIISSFFTDKAFAFVPNEAFTFDFNVHTFRMSHRKQEKINQALDLIQKVFASEEFKKRILSHKFNGRRGFEKSKGMSNRNIYKKILVGVETLYPYPNNTMDLDVALYTDEKSNVLAYTLPSTTRVWMNTKYFNKLKPSRIAGILVHEWMHKLGFEHEMNFTESRCESVPYAVGYIVRDLALKLE